MTSAANKRSSAGLHVDTLGAGVPPPDGFCGGIHTLKPQSSFRDLPVIAALASQQNGLGAAKGVEIDLAGKGDEKFPGLAGDGKSREVVVRHDGPPRKSVRRCQPLAGSAANRNPACTTCRATTRPFPEVTDASRGSRDAFGHDTLTSPRCHPRQAACHHSSPSTGKSSEPDVPPQLVTAGGSAQKRIGDRPRFHPNRSPDPSTSTFGGRPGFPGVALRPDAAATSAPNRALPNAKLPMVARRISSTTSGSSSWRNNSR